MSDNGELCCTISDDKSAKIFDVVNFGLYMSLTAIKMMKLKYSDYKFTVETPYLELHWTKGKKWF